MNNTRYVVQWNSWADLQAAAKKNGMPEGGEPFDYVETSDFDKEREYRTFRTAVAFGHRVRDFDTWKAPRIRRQQLAQNDTDDQGNAVEPMPDWETDATWEACEGCAINENNPDWTEAA